jgi:hypothetical protein
MIHPRIRLLLLAGLLALIPFVVSAPDVDAAYNCSVCEGSYTTAVGGANPSSHWGKGSDCSAAYNDLSTQIYQAAQADCRARGYMSSCDVQVVELACYFSNGQYISDGYGNYSCRTWGPFCQEP